MSANLLREAATIIRERAEKATVAPWEAIEGASGNWWVECPSTADVALDLHGENARYIATMHPGVGLVLAKWLDDLAAGWPWDEDGEGCVWDDGTPLHLDESVDSYGVTIARIIVGGAP